jgi:prepilin-type N-terminal cleavage/methylation domain-containing protein/prepilin-type processing-associated H-X9-DG protein
MTERHRNRARAFTLVELLVVIGIISALIAILMPALQKAKRSAERLHCLGNLRQIGIATYNYVGDHKGRLPEEATWCFFRLLPYVKNNVQVFQCRAARFPLTIDVNEGYTPSLHGIPNVAYGVNYSIRGSPLPIPPVFPGSGIRITQIRKPRIWIYVADAGSYAVLWYLADNPATNDRIAIARHNGVSRAVAFARRYGGNVLFLDSHAEYVTPPYDETGRKFNWNVTGEHPFGTFPLPADWGEPNN